MCCGRQPPARSSRTRYRMYLVHGLYRTSLLARNCAGRIWARRGAARCAPTRPCRANEFMKIIYFSLDYTPHDHRFLAALAETEHQVHYVRLQRGARQTEDRPVPEKIEQVLWEGGQQ